jgi:glutamine---fructose-6-phosphate transaminase (isomerizing)
MCGIFGIIYGRHAVESEVLNDLSYLFHASERRGKDASGLVAVTDNSIYIYKEPSPSRVLLEHIKGHLPDQPMTAFFGHTRLATNGTSEGNKNNQPIQHSGVIAVHNGIIVNEQKIRNTYSELLFHTEVDTEALVAQIGILEQRVGMKEAISSAFLTCEGTVSIALMSKRLKSIFLATNNGSLYYAQDTSGFVSFASEYRILKQALKGVRPELISRIQRLESGMMATVGLSGEGAVITKIDKHTTEQNTKHSFDVVDTSIYSQPDSPHLYCTDDDISRLEEMFRTTAQKMEKVRRCTRCVLPETFPGILFDKKGVCDVCLTYVPQKQSENGPEELRRILTQLQSRPLHAVLGTQVGMGFSGGRDSCYGLHMLVRKLGIRPIVYTYDWGVITDLGRRNQARMSGKLQVEHIIVSADIRKKRQYIRSNLQAWFRDPDLGMIPLLMAGDKQYFRYFNELGRELQFTHLILCENPLERTLFKYRFAGMKYSDLRTTTYITTWYQKFSILLYYAKKILRNPGYWNASLFDTFSGFVSYFIESNQVKYIQLFDYIKWNEEEINNILISEYDWEFSPDTHTSWRIGDGTAPWYNAVYYIGAGFSEHDTFRSNQIREGHISREKALDLLKRDNQLRASSLCWYFNTMEVTLRDAVSALESMPRHYANLRDKGSIPV